MIIVQHMLSVAILLCYVCESVRADSSRLKPAAVRLLINEFRQNLSYTILGRFYCKQHAHYKYEIIVQNLQSNSYELTSRAPEFRSPMFKVLLLLRRFLGVVCGIFEYLIHPLTVSRDTALPFFS